MENSFGILYFQPLIVSVFSFVDPSSALNKKIKDKRFIALNSTKMAPSWLFNKINNF